MKTQLLPILENELARYTAQKEALQLQQYPTDQEEHKQMLLAFYSEKILRLGVEIDREKLKNSTVRGPFVFQNTT